MRTAIAIVGAALVIAALAARRSGPLPPPAASRTEQPPAEPAPIDRPSAAADPFEVQDEVVFQRDVERLLETKTGPGGAVRRRAVIERTLRHLEWPDSQRRAFASACEAGVHEVDSAWAVREALFVPGDDAVHARYVEFKQLALARIERLLDPSREPEQQLRDRLEEWFDAIR